MVSNPRPSTGTKRKLLDADETLRDKNISGLIMYDEIEMSKNDTSVRWHVVS